MARLRYIFGEDQLPITPAPLLNIEEEGDSWWSGVQLNFAAVPIVSTIAAIALSASLCFGYQQQTEDIVPQPTITIDDDHWLPHVYYRPSPVYGIVWTFEQSSGVGTTLVEDELWQIYTPSYPSPTFLYSLPAVDDELPIGVVTAIFEWDAWAVVQPDPMAKQVLVSWADDNIVPQPQVLGIEDEYRLIWLPPYPPIIAHPYVADEEIVPQPVLLPDEDFWKVYTPPYEFLRFLYLPDPEEIPAGSFIVPPLIIQGPRLKGLLDKTRAIHVADKIRRKGETDEGIIIGQVS